VAIWRALGDRLMLTQSLGWLSMGAWLSGEPARALAQLEESRCVFDQCMPDAWTISCAAMILRNLGIVTRDQGDYVRAAEHFRESIKLARLKPDYRLDIASREACATSRAPAFFRATSGGPSFCIGRA
jgi:hypothetical protein